MPVMKWERDHKGVVSSEVFPDGATVEFEASGAKVTVTPKTPGQFTGIEIAQLGRSIHLNQISMQDIQNLDSDPLEPEIQLFINQLIQSSFAEAAAHRPGGDQKTAIITTRKSLAGNTVMKVEIDSVGTSKNLSHFNNAQAILKLEPYPSKSESLITNSQCYTVDTPSELIEIRLLRDPIKHPEPSELIEIRATHDPLKDLRPEELRVLGLSLVAKLFSDWENQPSDQTAGLR